MNDTLEKTRNLADEAANKARALTELSRRNVEHAVEKVGDTLQHARADMVPALEHASEQATQWAKRSSQQLRQGSRQLQAKASYAADNTKQYVREQPLKSVLIAVGVGAALMGIATLLGRKGPRH